jgi:hypothetical protein
MKNLKYKKFQYPDDLTFWVNSVDITIVSITAKGKFEGEGYTIFYFDEK